MAQIVNAVNSYESAYSRLPASSAAMNAATTLGEDFTFGTYGAYGAVAAPTVSIKDKGQPGMAANNVILAMDGHGNHSSYQTNNSEVMSILLDKEFFPGQPSALTVNAGHVKNPQKTQFLNATLVSDAASPGIGSDLVYRDPWGNPYIISMDLNADEKTRDAFYRQGKISQQSPNNQQVGLYGLVNSQSVTAPGNVNYFEYNGHVMVWSAGPDRAINSTLPANKGPNLDNVLSWKQ
jgi:hypothetical protein